MFYVLRTDIVDSLGQECLDLRKYDFLTITQPGKKADAFGWAVILQGISLPSILNVESC